MDARKPLVEIVKFLFLTIFFTSLFFYQFGVGLLFSLGLSLITLYSVSFIYDQFINIFLAVKFKKIELEKIKELSYQTIEVTCPCSKTAKQFIPIRVDRPNYYKCNKCERTVGVYINVETVLVTEPIANTSVDLLLANKLNEYTTKH